MGSVSASSSIERVLEKHSQELEKEQIDSAGTPLVVGVDLENNLYSISVTWKLSDGKTLPGPDIDIDTLAERFPDCNVGY